MKFDTGVEFAREGNVVKILWNDEETVSINVQFAKAKSNPAILINLRNNAIDESIGDVVIYQDRVAFVPEINDDSIDLTEAGGFEVDDPEDEDEDEDEF